jgi:hypothetical protein
MPASWQQFARGRMDAAVGICGRSGRHREWRLWFYIRNFGRNPMVIVTGSAAGLRCSIV